MKTQPLSVVLSLSLSLASPVGAFAQGAGNPAARRGSLPGYGVRILLRHPQKPSAAFLRKLHSAQARIGKLLDPYASKKRVESGIPARKTDIWMGRSWNPKLPIKERAKLIEQLRRNWGKGLRIELPAPPRIKKAPPRKRGAKRGHKPAVNNKSAGKMLASALPGVLHGPSGGTYFDRSILRNGGAIARDLKWVAAPAPKTAITAAQAAAAAARLPRARIKVGKAAAPPMRPYHAAVLKEAKAAGIDPEIIHAVIKAKSGYNAKKKGGGAYGLMMVSLIGAKWAGVNRKDMMTPEGNIRAGTIILKKLLKMFKGDVDRALAAYQIGAGAVRKSGGIPNDRRVKNFLASYQRAYRGAPGAKPVRPVVAPKNPNLRRVGETIRQGLSGAPDTWHPSLRRSFASTAKWSGLIDRFANRHGVDADIIESMMLNESGGRPWATSPAGAKGLMQLMPGTAREMGVKDRRDPGQNIMGGVKYLKRMMIKTGGNIVLAVAAYNSGPNYKAYRRGRIPTIRETVKYVTRVFHRYAQLTGRWFDYRRYMGETARKWSRREERALKRYGGLKTAKGSGEKMPPLPTPRPKMPRVKYANASGKVASLPKENQPTANRPPLQPSLPPPKTAGPDGSRAVGLPYRGRLVNGVRLSPVGTGYRSIRQSRGRFYGTGRLVKGIEWLGRYTQSEHPGSPPFSIGDLSRKGGGKISHHKSHQNGKDIDIINLWKDSNGRAIPSTEFARVSPTKSRSYGGKRIRFDTARNWTVVKGLVSNPYFKVQWIFTDTSHINAMLAHARKTGESRSLINKARRALNPESGHADHFHVRIY